MHGSPSIMCRATQLQIGRNIRLSCKEADKYGISYKKYRSTCITHGPIIDRVPRIKAQPELLLLLLL